MGWEGQVKNGHVSAKADCAGRTFPKGRNRLLGSPGGGTKWFASPEIQQIASDPYEGGTNRRVRYSKQTSGFTIGDALNDFVEWKRVETHRNRGIWFEGGRTIAGRVYFVLFTQSAPCPFDSARPARKNCH